MELIRRHARENNATVIIIAHRYATVEDVDEILVLEKGASWGGRRLLLHPLFLSLAASNRGPTAFLRFHAFRHNTRAGIVIERGTYEGLANKTNGAFRQLLEGKKREEEADAAEAAAS